MQVRQELDTDLPKVFAEGQTSEPIVEILGGAARRENVEVLVRGLKALRHLPAGRHERGLRFISEAFKRHFSPHQVLVADEEAEFKAFFVDVLVPRVHTP